MRVRFQQFVVYSHRGDDARCPLSIWVWLKTQQADGIHWITMKDNGLIGSVLPHFTQYFANVSSIKLVLNMTNQISFAVLRRFNMNEYI